MNYIWVFLVRVADFFHGERAIAEILCGSKAMRKVQKSDPKAIIDCEKIPIEKTNKGVFCGTKTPYQNMKLRSENYKNRPSIKELREILKKIGVEVTVSSGPLTVGYAVTGIKKVSARRLEREVIRDELIEAMATGLITGNDLDILNREFEP